MTYDAYHPSLFLEEKSLLRYTDDSEMALCICDSFKRMNGFNATDLARTYDRFFA